MAFLSLLLQNLVRVMNATKKDLNYPRKFLNLRVKFSHPSPFQALIIIAGKPFEVLLTVL